MIMAPVSVSPCQSHTAAENVGNHDGNSNKKRTSIHYPDDSTAAKRMSLPYGHRCRSLSESWAFSSPSTVVPEFQERKNGTSSPSSSSDSNCNNEKKEDEQLDQELLKTLSSFLRGEGNAAGSSYVAAKKDPRMTKGNNTSSITSGSAGPSKDKDESTTCDLVIKVRDYAYPKTHPYHLGQYPPEPEYEESDIEEDEEMEEDDEEEEDDDDQENHNGDRTQGHARGLYDFDAENSSELSFRDGQFLLIHCRQFPGWFLGEVDGKTGLVPENYVQLL
ncbi:hypothetical protein BGZ65_010438 [Modicella reniformis]|uniref:SH3 domain-containing protein n=1 Tax=Modicella reniformis TaxID=1440133 RepID=A0A9P6LTU2_9FUNG|nr:hypothetical protein BGZ65_010438 [Modicella reniformis]